MAREDGPEFVSWREEFLSQEKGSRVVHYYLEDAAGVPHLAVVGKERSLRHMLYVVSEDFHGPEGSGGADGQGMFARKWRSRREVVDWLESFLPAKTLTSNFSKFGPRMGNDVGLDGYSETGSFVCHNLGTTCSSDIMWSGPFWTCSKQLQHYQAFCRNGTTISTHSFALVMSEEENRYLAYLEDMYEDKKGLKKVKVRWFHQNQEFACAIPPPAPHPCEVFITSYSQVISVECVDDIATVLTPEHYEKCLDTLPNCSLVGMRFCFRQYSKNKFKHFDLRTLRGYFIQAAVLSLKVSPEKEKDGSDIIRVVKHCSPGKTKFSKEFERLYSKCLGTKICRGPQADSVPSYQKQNNKQSPGKHISVKFIGPQNQPVPTYSVGDKIEVLSQDSGIVGCWFRCTVLKPCTSHNKLKIQYDDLQNADDCGRLEERVPASTLALPDKLGVRCPGRLRIRPRPQQNTLVDYTALLPGSAVDVWQFSGWWEGIVVSTDSGSSDSLQIYFPGENFFRVCQLNDTRISKDWVKSRWVHIERKPDVLSRIPSVGVQTKQPDNLTSNGGLDSNSAMSDQELTAVQANSSGDKQTGVAAQTVVSLIDTGTASIEDDEKQTILRKQPRCNDAEDDCNGEETVADTQTEVSFTDAASAAVEDEQKTLLGKRPREDAVEQNCNGQVFTDKGPALDEEEQKILRKRPRDDDDDAEEHCNDEVFSLTDTASAAVEDERHTVLGKRPREDAVEQNCNGQVFTDKGSALDDDEQKILRKRPRDDDDAEEHCNDQVFSLTNKEAAPIEDERETLLEKQPRDDDAEQHCDDEVFSLTDRASASVEDEKQTVLGKRPRDDDDEQDCNGEVGVDVDVSKS
ncbi:hypothetical protein ACQ4PT_009553 [Festuca glaucescens]